MPADRFLQGARWQLQADERGDDRDWDAEVGRADDVADNGRWLDRPPGVSRREGGLGLILVDRLIDEVHIDRLPQGTVVRLRRRGPSAVGRTCGCTPNQAVRPSRSWP